MTLEDLLKQKPGPINLGPENFKQPPASEPEPEPEPEPEIDTAQTFFQKGVQHLKSKAPFDALPHLYASWAMDETCLKAANNIVIALWQLKCPDLAFKTVNKVLTIDPDNATARSHQKFLQSRMKKTG